jgi:hypothetical protein
MSAQRRFMDDDHIVQTLAANRANDPLDVRTLLRHSRRSQYFPNARLLNLFGEIRSEDSVAVAQ